MTKIIKWLALSIIAAVTAYTVYAAHTFGGLQNIPITEEAVKLLQGNNWISAGNIRTSGTLTVDGASTLTGDVTASGTLGATGAFTATSTSTLKGAVTADSVTVTNASSLRGAVTADSITVTNAATTGSIVNNGTSALKGAVTADSVTVTNNIIGQNLTASLPVFTGTSKELVSKSIANTLLALGIQKGTAETTADNTVTNTFGTAFSVAPVVITTPTGAAGTTALTNSVISVTESNFVYNCGVPSVTINWIAIGTP